MRAHVLQIAANKRGRAFPRDARIDGPGRQSGHPSRPTQATSAARLTGPQVRPEPDPTGAGRVRSVLICDDREDVRLELSRLVQLRSEDLVQGVGDTRALLGAYEANPTAQILIGVHSGSDFGADAFDGLIGAHPKASAIVFGSIIDIDLLAHVYARGAIGLLLWELGQPWSHHPVG